MSCSNTISIRMEILSSDLYGPILSALKLRSINPNENTLLIVGAKCVKWVDSAKCQTIKKNYDW